MTNHRPKIVLLLTFKLKGIQLQKVEEMEKNLTKASNNVNQKQIMIDGLNQSLDKLKRKVNIDYLEYCVILFFNL